MGLLFQLLVNLGHVQMHFAGNRLVGKLENFQGLFEGFAGFLVVAFAVMDPSQGIEIGGPIGSIAFEGFLDQFPGQVQCTGHLEPVPGG